MKYSDIERESSKVMLDMLNYKRVLDNISYRDAAAFFGMAPTTYSQYENGERNVHASEVPKIENFMGFEQGSLLDIVHTIAQQRLQTQMIIAERLYRYRRVGSKLSPATPDTGQRRLRLLRQFRLERVSPSYNPQAEAISLASQEDLPHANLTLRHADLDKLNQLGQFALIREYVTAPFYEVIYNRATKHSLPSV